jgi:outer membrane protein TolC
MKTRISFLIGIFLFHTGNSQELRLTVEEAVRMGLEKSKAIHASMMRVQYADARASEANALMLPSLKLSGGYTRLSDIPPSILNTPFGLVAISPTVLNNYNVRLSLQQPLFTGFRLQRNSDIADYNSQATQKEFEKDKSELVYNIKAAYWNLFKALDFQKVVDENVEQVRAHLKDVENWQKQGIATTNDVLKVQVQLSDARLRQIDANNGVQLARIGLNNAIGIPLETEVAVASAIQLDERQFPNLNALVLQALQKRPDLQSMELRVKAGDAAVSLAQASWWPQVFLTGNYMTARPNQRIFPIQDVFQDTWDVGVGISFDVWNWGTTVHQTDQARAQLAQVQDGYGQLRDAAVLDVTRNYLYLGRARERITVAGQGVQQAEESYRVTNAKFKQGLGMNSDLLDAEVALLQAKTNYTQALVDFGLAGAALERAIGE